MSPVLVLVLLGVAWVVVLAPPLLRARSRGQASDTIGDFSKHLGVLGRANGSAPTTPTSPRGGSLLPAPRSGSRRRTAAERRRLVLGVLLIGALTTAILAAVTGVQELWTANLVLDALVLAYLGALAYMGAVARERALKVRYLEPRRPAGAGSARRPVHSASSY